MPQVAGVDADIRAAVEASPLRMLPPGALDELVAGSVRTRTPAGSVTHREAYSAPPRYRAAHSRPQNEHPSAMAAVVGFRDSACIDDGSSECQGPSQRGRPGVAEQSGGCGSQQIRGKPHPSGAPSNGVTPESKIASSSGVNFPADFRITFPEEFAQPFWLVNRCGSLMRAAEAVATRRSARSSNTNAGSIGSE